MKPSYLYTENSFTVKGNLYIEMGLSFGHRTHFKFYFLNDHSFIST